MKDELQSLRNKLNRRMHKLSEKYDRIESKPWEEQQEDLNEDGYQQCDNCNDGGCSKNFSLKVRFPSLKIFDKKGCA